MKNNRQFEEILNRCIERLIRGGTVESCLLDHPAEARDLKPLLETFAAARTAARITPRTEFKAQAKYQFQMELAKMSETRREKAQVRGWHWRWQSAWSITVITALVVIFAGGGTVAAAGNSMPDSPLYGVKLAAEQVELALTPSDVGKADLNGRLAGKRVDEMNYMAEKGNTHEVQILAQRLNSNLQNIVQLAGGAGTNEARSGKGALTSGNNASTTAPASTNASQAVMAPAATALAPVPAPTTVAAPTTTSAPGTSRPPGTTTAPTTTLPPTTTATVPATTLPAITVTAPTALPPAAQTAPNDKSNAFGSGQSATLPSIAASAETDQAKIARILVDDASAALAKLNAALAAAPAEVRPAIRQAIAQSQLEYDTGLQILQQIANQAR